MAAEFGDFLGASIFAEGIGSTNWIRMGAETDEIEESESRTINVFHLDGSTLSGGNEASHGSTGRNRGPRLTRTEVQGHVEQHVAIQHWTPVRVPTARPHVTCVWCIPSPLCLDLHKSPQ